jgi:HlyD family secretion protein
MTRIRSLAAYGCTLLMLAACDDEAADAYGNFEAIEVVVSAEQAGKLIRFDPAEGARLAAGQVVGQIDDADLQLQRNELLAQQHASRARTGAAGAQVDVLYAQLVTARDEYARTRRLYEAEAATAQQMNHAAGEVRVLEERIDAARAQTTAVQQETGGVQARVAQLDEQIRRSRIENPISGTVLTTFVERGELVQPGTPLYEIASLDTLTLRAYVSGAQLSLLRIGAVVDVRIDAGADELMSVAGRVTWIASEAEFTPTPIQTREERTEQVYAVRIVVPNASGAIKIGMPAEVYFTAQR